MAINSVKVAYLKNDHTRISKTGLPLFRYCTVADPDLQMTWGGGRGGGHPGPEKIRKGGHSRKKIFLLSTFILNHIIGVYKFSHLTLELRIYNIHFSPAFSVFVKAP